MKRMLMLGGAALALSSSLAMAQPEDLLPDIFNDPPPAAPAPTPTPRAQPAPGPAPVAPAPGETSAPVIQPLPGDAPPTPAIADIDLPANFPSLAELEEMDESEINELLGLRPKFDVPPMARRAMERIGVISSSEGGFPSRALAGQPAALVRSALEGTRGPLVSRWGHILLRRTLASRMDAPDGMDPAEFAALRAALLNRMGEVRIARSLVQDVDGGNYTPELSAAAFTAFVETGDLLGACPISRLHSEHLESGEWTLTQAICDAFSGEERAADRRLQRALGTGEAEEIDVRLAQLFAGAAGDGGRGVTIEWDGVDELTPWRLAMARALGTELPDALRADAPARFDLFEATIPATPLPQRVQSADRAAERGILSARAMVDLYSQLYASDAVEAGERVPSVTLREAYVAEDPAARIAVMRGLWGEDVNYGRMVLTAYAAARLPATEALAGDAGPVLASMLSAGLDANAMRWADVVEEGSLGWALLALANPASGAVDEGAFRTFASDDSSAESRKTQFLLAGLAGLGRLDNAVVGELAGDLGIDFNRQTAWSERIGQAGRYRNQALVALLAGVGMQGDGWHRMTARHLYHIVSALNAAGLSAEARMIAAEAVARG
ncbi:hypothetical protein [Alteraurantiacibacter aquimixticola]|uniref:Antifreeze protein n=1 Tax=Alteraurantiacibacter aquimixticola TaxID=2489173 RepID=A0A4T3F4C4_9SPHN|nr:hypothetical protein [Alteraurantiacibacter aquimixticola]TIX52018.1 hypothetical protein E5222_06220 [Alteraurantiacibacter aquimixticola]